MNGEEVRAAGELSLPGHPRRVSLLLWAIGWMMIASGPRADLASSLQLLRAVGPEGQGNEAAARGWAEVVAIEPQHLPEILAAMDGAGDLARNWILSAATTIADRSAARGGKLPVAAL